MSEVPDYLALYNSGMSFNEIAAATGTSRATVGRKLHALGFTPRPQLEAAREGKRKRRAEIIRATRQLSADGMPELPTSDAQIVWLRNKVKSALSAASDAVYETRMLEDRLRELEAKVAALIRT
jgi:hypothetical protein